MLKIKDDVDLKELEDFGFKFCENKVLPHNSTYDCYEIQIKGCTPQIYVRAFEKREIHVSIPSGRSLTKLYDLIKADLVEKVPDV